MYHTTPFQNMFFMGFAAFILLLSVVIIIAGIILIHDLPYHIAKRRDHPQQDAIRCMSIMGLVLFPLWLLSMVWAFMRSEVSYFGPVHPKFKTQDTEKGEVSVDVSVKKNEDDQVVPDLDDDVIDIKEPQKRTEKVVEKKTENSEKAKIQE